MAAENSGARVERAVVILVLIILTVVVAYGEFARQRAEREARARHAALAEEIAAARNEAQAAFTSLIPQEVVARANASVYAIVVNNRLFGTAFVVDRENGVLVTAAHVADAIPFDEEDARIRIFNRLNGNAIAIKEVRNHAGFGAFRELVEDFQPVRPQSHLLRPQILPLRDLAFDAALITVDPIDPDTGENRLGPDLPIADEATLLDLSAGAPIAVIGFPYDTLDDGFSAESATSRVDRGVVSAMIAPLDNAAAKGDPTIANLIIHRLSTAGGNSGSPVLNASGEVIGIHTHGIESLSGNADGAAQRADVIYDLLEEARDERRLRETFLPAWTQLLSFWRSAKIVLPWSFYLERTDPDRADTTLISDFDLNAGAPFTLEMMSLEFGETQEGFTLAADDIAVSDIGGGDGSFLTPSESEGRPVFQIDRTGEYATATFTIDRTKENVIYAFDYSLRRQLGFCRLAAYWRKIGDTRLAIQPTRPSTELYFPSTEQGGDETYQIVFHRRQKCDPASQAFDAGVLSWAPGDGAAPANIVQALFGGRDTIQFETADRPAAAKIMNFPKLRCVMSKKPSDRSCNRSDYIEAELLVEEE